MDQRSETNLHGVHPDLVKIVKKAAEKISFEVICGCRTLAAQKTAVATGHSQTLHSRHFPNKEGLACAVDVAALVDGHISWLPADYLPIYNAIEAAAAELKLHVEWGGNWKTIKDWGHFQLPWSLYP